MAVLQVSLITFISAYITIAKPLVPSGCDSAVSCDNLLLPSGNMTLLPNSQGNTTRNLSTISFKPPVCTEWLDRDGYECNDTARETITDVERLRDPPQGISRADYAHLVFLWISSIGNQIHSSEYRGEKQTPGHREPYNGSELVITAAGFGLLHLRNCMALGQVLLTKLPKGEDRTPYMTFNVSQVWGSSNVLSGIGYLKPIASSHDLSSYEK